MSKFLDYEGLSYYTQKVRGNMNTIADQSIVYNIAPLKAQDKNGVVESVDGYVASFIGTFTSTASYSITKSFSPPITGEYRIMMNNALVLSTGHISTFLWDNTTSRGIVIPSTYIVELDATHSYVFAFSDMTLNATISGTFKLQIILKSLYDSGFTNYQPYALSNVQITDFIQTPANNTDIDNIWDNT